MPTPSYARVGLVLAVFLLSSEAHAEDAHGGPPAPEVPTPGRDREKAESNDQDNVVETIVANTPSASPRPMSVPDAETDRTRISGWARESAEWTLTPTQAGATPTPFDVPHDRLISRTQLYAQATHARGGWFEASVSGVLGYSLRVEGPSDRGTFDGINGQGANADAQAELRELYVGFFSKYVDVRIGQQRVAWGRTDVRSPNDVVNAFDLRDPILTETELRHLPTPLVRADIDLRALDIQLVATPIFVPDAYDVYGTNWSAIQQDAPAPIRGLFGAVSPLVSPTKDAQFNALLHDTQAPAPDWSAPSAGARVSSTLGRVDVAAYYHFGFDTTPYVSLAPSFARFLATTAFQTFRPSDLTPILQNLDAGVQPFSAAYVRRHHVGFDAAATAGPLIFRVDAAYETKRVFYRPDLTSFASPSFSAVGGVEYQTGDVDKVILVEATYDGIVDTPRTSLLGYNQHSVGVASTIRWPLGAGYSIDARGLVGVAPESFVLQPAFRWQPNDAWTFKIGGVLLGGEGESIGWYYRHNSSAFAQAKYSF